MSDRSIKSAERTLFLFELFAGAQQPMTVSEISARMQMPQSSTSVLLKALLQLGYLEYDAAARTYFPSLRIALLGTWLRRRRERSGRLPPLLSALAQSTGASAMLAMRNGVDAQYIMAQFGDDPLRLHVESGLRRPLACCATGWALLSRESDREIGKIIRRTQAEAARPLWRKTAARAVEEIALVRRRGYALSHGETTPGASAVAMLLPNIDEHHAFAVAVGGPIARIEERLDRILEALERLKRDFAKGSALLFSETLEAARLSADDAHLDAAEAEAYLKTFQSQ
ncbi:MAG: IclR family transcriptional regulator [Pseudomonadota bacterium]